MKERGEIKAIADKMATFDKTCNFLPYRANKKNRKWLDRKTKHFVKLNPKQKLEKKQN